MKQAIVIRLDPRIRVGKLAAQACHASVAAPFAARRDDVSRWLEERQTKVVLKAASVDPLNLQTRCASLGLDHALVSDALSERAFPPSARGTVEFRVLLKSTGKDILEFELLSERSERALRLRFDSAHGGLTLELGGVESEPVPFIVGEWHQVKLAFDGGQGWYEVWVDRKKLKERVELTIKGETLERMVFRTGSWRGDVRLLFLDGEPGAPGLDAEDLPAAGEKVPESVFWIDDVKTTGK